MRLIFLIQVIAKKSIGKNLILIRLYPSDQQNSKAKCQASNSPKLVERQTSPHTRKSNNESSDSDIIIISNNDTLKLDLVIAPSTLKSPCILALSMTPVIKKHAQFEDCVITPNVHVTQQRPELVNSSNVNNPDQAITHSYESFPIPILPDYTPSSSHTDHNFNRHTRPLKTQEDFTPPPAFPFFGIGYPKIPSYRTSHRLNSLEWLVHLAVVSQLT